MQVEHAKVEDLRKNHRGHVIAPEDSAYDSGRRVWNAMIDRRPALIVRPRSAVDVIAAVNFARDNRLPLAIRGENMGHNVARFAELLANYEIDDVRAAVAEAIERETPTASSVASLLDRRVRARSAPQVLPAHLPDDPRVRNLDVISHDPASYDVLARKVPNVK